MTRTEFNDHWNRDFAPLTAEAMPSYDEFKISERMLEDYLDIFRGYNSREGENIMPYPHPFFDDNGNSLFEKKPCIKYILLGEVRPPLKPPILSSCAPINGDRNNSFFYDIRHVKPTQPWLSAPRLNWGCPLFTPCSNNKIDTLLCLAINGVILLDIFPFATSITSALRQNLNVTGVTRSYWDNPMNIYNIQDRVRGLSPLLCKEWDLTMVAPCIISEHIVNPINGFPTLASVPVGIHPATFRDILPDPTRCIRANNWRKVAISSAGFGPTANLINASF